MSDTLEQVGGLLTVSKAAKWMTVSRSTMYRLPIPYVMIGSRRAYRIEDLRTYAELNLNRPALKRAS